MTKPRIKVKVRIGHNGATFSTFIHNGEQVTVTHERPKHEVPDIDDIVTRLYDARLHGYYATARKYDRFLHGLVVLFD